MVLITKNNEIEKAVQLVTNLTSQDGKIPKELKDKIQLSIPLGAFNNKYCDYFDTAEVLNTASQGFAVLQSDRDTYITGATLGYTKDVTSTSTDFRLNVNINGTTVILLILPCLTTTAGTDSISITFPFPLKLDRGSTSTITSTTAVGNHRYTGTLNGFTYQSDITNTN